MIYSQYGSGSGSTDDFHIWYGDIALKTDLTSDGEENTEVCPLDLPGTSSIKSWNIDLAQLRINDKIR